MKLENDFKLAAIEAEAYNTKVGDIEKEKEQLKINLAALKMINEKEREKVKNLNEALSIANKITVDSSLSSMELAQSHDIFDQRSGRSLGKSQQHGRMDTPSPSREDRFSMLLTRCESAIKA